MRTSIPKNNFFPNKLSQEQTLRGASSSENLPLREECIICFSERELQSLSFFVPRVPKRRCKFFIIKAAPLVVTVVVNFPELREQLSDGNKIIQTAQNYVFKANRTAGLNGHPHQSRGQSAGDTEPRGHAG
jgi:hypothetical protein